MKNNKKKGSIILRVAAIVVSIYMIVSLCTLWQNLVNEQNSLAELERVKAEKISQIDYLNSLLDGGKDREIIEKAARERLGYVYAGEEVYIDISGN